jgi:hypothetical protein
VRIDRETIARLGATLRRSSGMFYPQLERALLQHEHCLFAAVEARLGDPALCARSTGWWPPSAGHSWTSSEQGRTSPSRGDSDAAQGRQRCRAARPTPIAWLTPVHINSGSMTQRGEGAWILWGWDERGGGGMTRGRRRERSGRRCLSTTASVCCWR